MGNHMELMFRCRIEGLITEREGMVAANQMRICCDQSPAYAEEDFRGVQCQLALIDEQLRNY